MDATLPAPIVHSDHRAGRTWELGRQGPDGPAGLPTPLHSRRVCVASSRLASWSCSEVDCAACG